MHPAIAQHILGIFAIYQSYQFNSYIHKSCKD